MAILGPIGPPEIIIILIVLLLVFGASRLPEMGRSLGRGMREFKDSVTGEEKPPALPTPDDDDTRSDAETKSEKTERETVS